MSENTINFVPHCVMCIALIGKTVCDKKTKIYLKSYEVFLVSNCHSSFFCQKVNAKNLTTGKVVNFNVLICPFIEAVFYFTNELFVFLDENSPALSNRLDEIWPQHGDITRKSYEVKCSVPL